MLKRDTIKQIAKVIGMHPAKLTQAIKAKDIVAISIADVQSFTQDELSSRDNQMKQTGRLEGERIGENIGKEIAVKEAKKHFGLDYEGKDLNQMVFQAKMNMARGDQYLKEQIKLLEKSVVQKEAEISQAKAKHDEVRFNVQILSALPKDRSDTISDEEYITLVRNSMGFDQSNGQIVASKDGREMRIERTGEPIALPIVIKDFFQERNWIHQEPLPIYGGRGGGDRLPGGHYSKLSEVSRDWEASGKNIATAEFHIHLNKLVKENPNFVFDLPGF